MSSEDRADPSLEQARAVLREHREELLRQPGVTAVGIGFKAVNGASTGQLAIVVSVREKRTGVPPERRIPAELGGVPTDVVEEDPHLKRASTDPLERFNPLFGGISLSAFVTPNAMGTVGCFIYTPGDPAQGVAEGDYLLTCQHVLEDAHPVRDPDVIQPMTTAVPIPADYLCGAYTAGIMDATRDCAIVQVVGREYRNEVPNYPFRPGNRKLRGVAAPTPGQTVYKYGSTTAFTEGVVRRIDWSWNDLRDIVVIDSSDGNDGTWAGEGDSGSVAITQDGDLVVGLNFAYDNTGGRVVSPVGYAYPIETQMNAFSASGGTRLSDAG
ncbi:MAG TPA: serine protease [Longimicrobium sp.]|nr:serine protease [Longimicrobium sp.]